MNQSRREFLKISSLGIGGVALSAPLFNWANGAIASEEVPAGDFVNRTPTYCEVCFWKCAGWVYKNEEGDIWKIIGNDDDPHCNGRFCPRGTGGVGMYYDEDRLKTPLIRKTIDGKQQFVEASWDEALDIVSSEFKRVKRKHGPGAIALSHGSHHNWGNIGYRFSAHARFMSILGAINAEHNPDSWEGWYWGAKHVWGCEPVGKQSYQSNIIPDIAEHTDMLLFWGCDPETTPWGWGGQTISQLCYWFSELGIKQVYVCGWNRCCHF